MANDVPVQMYPGGYVGTQGSSDDTQGSYYDSGSSSSGEEGSWGFLESSSDSGSPPRESPTEEPVKQIIMKQVRERLSLALRDSFMERIKNKNGKYKTCTIIIEDLAVDFKIIIFL